MVNNEFSKLKLTPPPFFTLLRSLETPVMSRTLSKFENVKTWTNFGIGNSMVVFILENDGKCTRCMKSRGFYSAQNLSKKPFHPFLDTF